MRCVCLVLWLLLAAGSVRAQDFVTVNGLADFRLVSPSDQRSAFDGGLGKLRYSGEGDQGVKPVVGQLLLDVKVRPVDGLALVGSFRYAPDQKTAVDIIESYARWQPLSTGPWRYGVKVGAFFPPISLENEAIGWTSPWTITPSAINSWVGDELRTIGVEAHLERRFGSITAEVTGAAFGWNEPAGVLIADRGWSMNDRPVGLLDTTREPDALAVLIGARAPLYAHLFREIDDQPGWYAETSLRQDGLGRATLLYYDNRADPMAERAGAHAWQTDFAAAGIELDFGDLVLLSQAMKGTTTIAVGDEDEGEDYFFTTRFQSAYLLAGQYFGDWRVAGRVDVFATQDQNEHGHAFTAAVTWAPYRWLRVTGEALQLYSYRPERQLEGQSPAADETQIQLALRLEY